jgi:hypothetical protein
MALFNKLFGKKKPDKSPNAEIYLDILTQMFGEPYVIRKVEVSDGGTPVHVFFWRDLPEEGTLTSVTYGLSESSHPDWKNGKCELIVSLDTTDEDWGIAAGIFAASYRGKKAFTYGSIFTTDNPISKESDMNGFFTFAPSFLDKAQAQIQLPDYDIFLTGMYPVYREEIAVYKEIGLEKFWHHKNLDMYNVHRARVILTE